MTATTPPPVLEGGEEELRALLEKATPGPWYVTPNPMRTDGVFLTRERSAHERPAYPTQLPPAICNGQLTLEDAALTAAARNHLPALLSALAGMREDMRKALDIIETGFRKPFDHLDGCLFKNDPRMPCQCDPVGRMKRFRDQAMAFLDEKRAALQTQERTNGR